MRQANDHPHKLYHGVGHHDQGRNERSQEHHRKALAVTLWFWQGLCCGMKLVREALAVRGGVEDMVVC